VRLPAAGRKALTEKPCGAASADSAAEVPGHKPER
jgi:hypothetical protein